MVFQATNSDTLFAGPCWFKHWLAAFGAAHSGHWRSHGTNQEVCIPYSVVKRRVGPVAMDVVQAAANSHTPRFDTLEGSPTLRDLRRMMRELNAHMMEFPFLSMGSRLLANVRAAANRYPCQLELCERSAFVDCRGSWDNYWLGRSKNARASWGYAERKLIREGMEVIQLETPDAVFAMLPVVYAIEASGWKGKLGTAIQQDEATTAFYNAVIPELATSGNIRLFMLRFKGEYIAFHLTTLHQRVMSLLKIGYLEEYSKLSPGQALRLQILRLAFASPEIDVFDMEGGGFEEKSRWATDHEDLYLLRVYRRSPQGLALWVRFAGLPRVKSIVSSKPADKVDEHPPSNAES